MFWTKSETWDKVERVEKRQDVLEKKVDAMESGVKQDLLSLREEIHEQKRRILRMSNIVMMGVPETAAGLQAAKQILSVIAPARNHTLHDTRIGDPNGRKPRPLRIVFPSAAEKSAALNNRKLLAGREEFRSISVRKDLTHKEQEEWKAKVASRSSNGGRKTRASLKRKSDQEHISQPRPKENRVEVSTEDGNMVVD